MDDLFGRRCLIPYGYSERPFVYKIVSSDLKSNTWVEPPMTAQSEANPVHHDHYEDILIVVLDTLVSDDSKLHRVALKDVVLLPERSGWINVKDRLPEEHKSIFAPWFGTAKWSKAMWQHESDFVLACQRFEDGSQIVIRTNTHDGQWFQSVSKLPGKITHWMPLPEPPEGVKQNVADS